MKSTKFSKQLILNKETIVNIGDDKMKELHGGISNLQCAILTLLGCPTETACWSNCAAGLAC